MNTDVRTGPEAQWWLRSRGQRPAQDYTWLPVRSGSAVPPPVASDPMQINAPGSLSIFVGWLRIADDDALVLFADGLMVRDAPTDHQGRPIEISALGIAYDRSGADSIAAALRSVVAGPAPGSQLAGCVSYAPAIPSGFAVDSLDFLSVIRSTPNTVIEPPDLHDLRWGPRSSLRQAAADVANEISAGYWPGSSSVAGPSILLAASDLIGDAWCAECQPFRAVGDLLTAPTESRYVPPGPQRGGRGKVVRRRRVALALLLLTLILVVAILVALT